MSNFLKYCKSSNSEIEIFYNVLSENERNKVLTQFKPYLRNIENCPGLQSYPNLHIICEKNNSFFNPFNKIKKRLKINNAIEKSWINYTDEELSYTSWHNHLNASYEKTCVYMLENPEKNGTWFNIDGQIYKLKSPTNSMILFPNHLIHTVPDDIKKPRYSLAIDFMER